MRAVMLMKRAGWIVIAFLLCPTQISMTRADPGSCIARVSSYVADVDHLLAKEKNWITPFIDLNNRSFPFVDCDTDALLEVVWQSRFRRPITYNPRTKQYFIVFASHDVRVGFAYAALEKRSNTPFAGWVEK
jgi:hypothetical protein